MKIAVYDPLTTFTSFAEWSGRNHDVSYIPFAMNEAEREVLHYQHDVVWYEFVLPEFAADTNRLAKMAYTVVRLHGFELFTPALMQTNWDRVDKLLTVSPEVVDILDRARARVDFPVADILFNGVDNSKFFKQPNKEYGKNIGVIGWINHKKCPPLALQCFEKIAKDGYHINFLGASQDTRYDLYLDHMVREMGIRDQVHFLGKIPWEDVPKFCWDMDYVAHFALFESFGQALMEAIACGNLPLIHRSTGIARRFGENMTWATVDEFVELIRAYEGIDDKEAIADANRKAILSKYSFEDQVAVLDGVLSDVSAEVGK